MPYDYTLWNPEANDFLVYKKGLSSERIARCASVFDAELVVAALNLLELEEQIDGLGK